MTKLDVHVGGSFRESKQRILGAVARAVKGETVNEDHVTFASWDALARVMTSKRFEMLRHLHKNPEINVAALARSLGRDYKRVHEDVDVLLEAGLIERDNGTFRAQYDEIRTLIAL